MTGVQTCALPICGLEVGATGFDPKVSLDDPEALTKIRRELKDAGAERIWYIDRKSVV